jgi:LacI family transcriptional regulator
MVKRTTRQDVALAAGVSGATVSRVYNSPQLVESATAERVRSAALALGFVPDKNASALRRGSSSPLLFLEIDDHLGYRWPGQRAYQSLYGEIVRAVVHAAQTRPRTLQLVSLPSVDSIGALDQWGDFAGILGFDVADQQTADALAKWGRPVVCCHHGDHLQRVSTVCTDNFAGGVLQARFLLQKNHQRWAYVTGMRSKVRSHQRRWEGFSTLGEPALLVDDVLGFSEGRLAGGRLASAVRQKTITAIACVNDLTALGVVRGLEAEGIVVPHEVEVVGYDNLVVNGLLGQGIPTIEARLPLVYTKALEVLGNLADGGGVECHETVSPLTIE